MMIRRARSLAPLVLSALLAVAPACVRALPPVSLMLPDDAPGFPIVFFGMHVHNNPGQPERWPSIPIGSLRLWDARVSWPQLEAKRGEWQFARLDTYVDWAQAHGVQILLPLGLSPTWASARPQEPSAYGSAAGSGAGYAAEPASPDDWRTYVRTVAQRYKGRIRYYELWNEVTDKGFFTGSVVDLASLARVAKEELKAVDPSIQLVGPSAVSLGERQTARPAEFMAAAGRGVADIASFHLYHGDHAPELKLGMAPNIRRQLVNRGFGDVPMWNTETGYYMAPPPALVGKSDGKYNITPQEAAAYLPRDMLLGRAMGFERFFWFAWDNDFLGFLEPRTDTLRPHAKVLAQFISLLTDSHLSACERDVDGRWRCSLRLKDGTPALAVWSDPSARQALEVAAPWPGQRVVLDGIDRGTVLGVSVALGPVVQLLIKRPR